MAVFSNMVVAESGKTMYAKAISGKTIKFTQARVGSGTPTGSIESLTALVEEVGTGAITEINVTDGKAVMTVEVSNEDFTEQLKITEIGLFAKIVNEDGTEEAEALYAYCYAMEGTDVIPPITNGHVDWVMQLELYISNATGSTTEQGGATFIPTVTATAADGSTVFLSDATASVDYAVSGNLVTAFYNITGTLANMESAENGLSLTITLPKKSAVACRVHSKMEVVTAENEAVLVDISGVIAKDGEIIEIDYFGSTNGTFSLMLTAQYMA